MSRTIEGEDRQAENHEWKPGLQPSPRPDDASPVRSKPRRILNNIVAVVVLTLVVAFMIYAGVRSSRGPKVSSVIGNSEPLQADTAKGKQAPDFVLQDLDGRQVKLSDFRGKAVVLNFWATFCGPCKVEMPWFVELQKQYGPEGLEIVGVALDDAGKDAIAKFAKDMGVNYTILQGKDDVGDAYGAVGLPATYYIDRNGKIVDSVLGLVSRGEIEDDIKKTIAEGKTAAGVPAKSVKASS